MKGKKSLSLNRVILVSAVAGCLVIMTLLACMDYFLIGNYQKAGLLERRQAVEKLAKAYEGDLGEIQKYLYDIYINDIRFAALGSGVSQEDSFEYEYELAQDFKSKMLLNGWLHGYFLYDYQNQFRRYSYDGGKISGKVQEQLEKLQEDMIESPAAGWNWTFVQAEDGVYGLLYCRKNYALLEFVYAFGSGEKQLEIKGTEGQSVFFTNDGKLLKSSSGKGRELETEENLAEQTQNYNNNFSRNHAFSQYLLQKVTGTQLWVGMAVKLDFFSYMNVPQLLLVILTGAVLAGFFVLYRYLKRKFVYPLVKLQNTMDEISRGNWDSHMEDTGNLEEIQKVNEAMEAMVAEIRRQKITVYEETIHRQKAQMQYLKLQLKPHFYLNSLKTLNVLARRGDKERAQDLIMELSYHLRYLLQAEREMVELAAERDYVKNYEKMQGILTGREFSISWNVAEDALSWMIPTLAIQTFVENSLKYARMEEPGSTLHIRVHGEILETEEGKFLDLRVQDNGKGYPEQILEEINGEARSGGGSVGILNLKRRCRILYGQKAEFYFCNEDGAVSELILPKREEAEDESVDRR